MPTAIPTEPIGSIPRPPELIDALAANDAADPGPFRYRHRAARSHAAARRLPGVPVMGTAVAARGLGVAA